jgi:hypothetical protein
MAVLSTTAFGKEWLSNFDPSDRATAALLIDRLMLVSASDFTSAMFGLLSQAVGRQGVTGLPLALYAEREVEMVVGDVKPIFPGSETGRAQGDGVPPVLVDPLMQDVGSEGILAALISKFCKANSSSAISHPGPDQLRATKARRIVLVTDFIGSGNRVYQMLDAFSKVASIQSWRSYKLISFEVICYSATEYGFATVKRHPLAPLVTMHVACPVVDEAFEGAELGAVKLLCKNYPKRSRFPFGFNRTGSLIAFSHGIPNNAPSILHSSSSGWKPLFVGRSTLSASLDAVADSTELIAQNSKRVLGIRNARSVLAQSEGELWAHSMLVLDAVRTGFRTPARVSARTQIPMSRTEEIFALALTAGWLTLKSSLTSLGRRELAHLKRRNVLTDVLASKPDTMYFPNQLRAQ